MSKLHDQFGDLVVVYQCCGTIKYQESGSTHQEKCTFEIGQAATGAIVIHINKFLRQMRQKIELDGTIEDGRKLVAQGDVRRIDHISSTQCFLHSEAPFHSNDPFHFTVGKLDWADVAQMKFAITNFLYCGNDADSNSWMTGIGRLNVRLNGTDVSIEKVENYTDVINSVGRGERTEVTSRLIIDVAGKSKDEILKLAHGICDLLTIGTGRKISWISYTVSNASVTDVYSFNEYRFTDMRSGRELIDFTDGKTIATFLEQCYPAYSTYDSKSPGMLHSVGLMLIDANSKGFMRTRALILFSILDAVSYTESNHITLKGRIRDIVDSYRVPIEKCQAKRCGRGCGTCQPKCDACKNQCEAECEIGDFVDDRHSIVHKLQFPSSDEDKEYYKVLSVFHRLLLRMLGYESYFVDVRYRHDSRFRTNLLRPTC